MRRSYLSKNKKIRRLQQIATVVIALLFFLFTWYNSVKNRAQIVDEAPEIEVFHTVHFIDAQQGDCTLIETSDGKFALIDASTYEAVGNVTQFLDSRNVEEIEYLIFTHPHEDHIGGGKTVLENYKVKNVIMTDRTESTTAYSSLIKQLEVSKETNGTRVIMPKEGDVFRLCDITLSIISDGKGYEELNNSSICLKVGYGKSTFLFTGDAEWEVEYDLIRRGVSLDAEIFKCGHHGSSTSNTERFMQKVNPDLCIISCGKDNDYGHPHREVRDYLKSHKIPYYITHEVGNISISFGKKNILSPVFTVLDQAEAAKPFIVDEELNLSDVSF